MKKYERPIFVMNEETAEGVYMASGCYTATARITQKPQTGRGNYVIQVDGKHDATHTCDAQTLTISFNIPVTYQYSGGTLQGGNGSNTLVIGYSYHNNPIDNIGLGNLTVEADEGLEITGVSITD